MGVRPSPQITDIRIKDIIDDVISKFQHADKLNYYGRYREDGFIRFSSNHCCILSLKN